MMCGNNPLYSLLHAVLETAGKLPEIPRYRDTYTSMSAAESVTIVIYTRTGGGNREDYEAENDALAAHPLFIRDYDDDFDRTFAHWVFKVPDEWHERVLQMHKFLSRVPKGQPPGEKFKASMASLGQGEAPTYDLPDEKECEAFDTLVFGMAHELGLITEEVTP